MVVICQQVCSIVNLRCLIYCSRVKVGVLESEREDTKRHRIAISYCTNDSSIDGKTDGSQAKSIVAVTLSVCIEDVTIYRSDSTILRL